MVNAKPEIIGGVAAKIAPRFGLTPTAVTLALTTALSIGANIYQHMTAFDSGWSAYETAVREGTAELDGKRFDIMTQADIEAMASKVRSDTIIEMQGQVNQAYQSAIEGIQDVHAQNVNTPVQPLAPDAIDWGSVNVPNSERVRFDQFDRRRANRDSERADTATDYRTVFAGYPTVDTPTASAQELGLAGTREDTGR